MEQVKLPPLGLRPRIFALENRYVEVSDAINRYLDADWPVPSDWWKELEELFQQIRRLRNEGPIL